MSSGSVLLMVVISVIVSVFVGSKCKTNMGVVALILGAILAWFALGVSPGVYYTWWPSKVMLQLLGIMFFFGFAIESKTVDAIADHVLWLTRGNVKIYPFLFPLLAAVLGLMGISPMAYNSLLLPIIAGICLHTNLNPVFLFLSYLVGNQLGMISPLGITGIVSSGVLTSAVGEETASAIMSRLYLNNAICGIVILLGVYVIFRGWRIKLVDEWADNVTHRPAPFNRDQKIVLTTALIAVALLVFPSLLGFSKFSGGMDVGWVYMLAGVVCAIFRVGDTGKVISTRIPWSIFLLFGGFAMLINVASTSGSVELLSSFISANMPSFLTAPVVGTLSGLIGVISDAIGVVLPSIIPVGAQIMENSSVSGTAIISAIVIGAQVTATAPLSAGGAQSLAYMPDQLGKKLFGAQMAFAFGCLLLNGLLCLVGVYG